jgi:2-polyprenyl-3-methyl-5-hydroxy-6-metoxy-1,4-benzoquinol methylase
MTAMNQERINCPLCAGAEYSPWATENGFAAVRCSACKLLYVNPRPVLSQIDETVRTGAHTGEASHLNVVAHREVGKPARYRKIIAEMFADVLRKPEPLTWLDVGAGFGEVVEAVASLAPPGSRVEGLEPMKPKVEHARARGLHIREGFLAQVDQQYGFVSLINVFSHIPDFHDFLQQLRRIMAPGAEILVETGNAADIGDRRNFPGELILPDHLVFAGERQICQFLTAAGFQIVSVRRERIDGVVYFAKNLVKRLLGRRLPISLPYASPTRTLLVRARLT